MINVKTTPLKLWRYYVKYRFLRFFFGQYTKKRGSQSVTRPTSRGSGIAQIVSNEQR